MTEKEYYTYLHRNNSGHVFYVGCATTNPKKRGVRAKLQRAYSTSGHSMVWDETAKNGYAVEILSFFNTKIEAYTEEVKLIAQYRADGEPLVNICSGGAGVPGAKDSSDVRRKKSITKIGNLNPMHGKTSGKSPVARPVIHMQSGVFYDSIQEAADVFGYKMKTLYNWLSGHRTNPTSLEFA